MKFIILPILGVFAFRTSGVSADCCQTSGERPEGYERLGASMGLTTNGSNKVCEVDGTNSCNIDSSMAFCPTPPKLKFPSCSQITIGSPCGTTFKDYTFHSVCKAGTGDDDYGCCIISSFTRGDGFTVCGNYGTTISCGSIQPSWKTCVGKTFFKPTPTPTSLTSTPPTQTPLTPNPPTPTPLTPTPPTKNSPTPTPPTQTPPTPNLLGDTPSSAGKIGMGYVWFVAAAAAFAGIN